MLGRDTQWRQGSVLKDEDAHTLGLITGDASEQQKAVLISHDCDLPHPGESHIEVIIGTIIRSADKMYARARHPRKIHLVYSVQEGMDSIAIELSHSSRMVVAKEVLERVGSHDESMILPDEEKRSLKQWLAARYGRPAFPSEFELRLKKKLGKREVGKQLENLVSPISHHLIGVFFDLQDCRHKELEVGDPYPLTITLAYDATEGSVDARKEAERVAKEIGKLFKDAYGEGTGCEEIDLEQCDAVADTYMSLAALRRVDQWRFEYMSLREDPPSDFLSAGTHSIGS